MRQKVVADEEGHEDKVVNDALERQLGAQRVVLGTKGLTKNDEGFRGSRSSEGRQAGNGGSRRRHLAQFEVEVFAEEADVEELELVRLLEGDGLARLGARAHNLLLAQDAKVRLVEGEGQEDQVRVEAVQAVPRVGVVLGLALEAAHKLHDLVLALAGRLVAA